MTFTFATYNVLATGYIRREWYPSTPHQLLADAHRLPALADRVAGLGADLCCLQEVEREAYALIEERVHELGYDGRLAMKGGHRPDGCAVFYRRDRFDLLAHERHEFADGNGDRPTGYVAQVLLLGTGDRAVHVVNTHLTWDAPDTPLEARRGLRQAHEIVAMCERQRDGVPWIVCGDLNAEPDSDVVRAFRRAGFAYTHAGAPAPTCNANRRAKLIDYIFFEPPLVAEAHAVDPVDDTTPLPSETQPSDHVPVVATFRWDGE